MEYKIQTLVSVYPNGHAKFSIYKSEYIEFKQISCFSNRLPVTQIYSQIRSLFSSILVFLFSFHLKC